MPKPSPQLDGPRILDLFGEIDGLLQERVEILVVGGAALAVHWSEQASYRRITYDVDSARAASVFSDPARTTLVVDTVSRMLSTPLRDAVWTVAERQCLDADWINNDVVDKMSADVDYRPESIFNGQRLRVYRPALTIILAMKLKSARMDKDLLDAARLAGETKMTITADLLNLLEFTFGPEIVDAERERFVRKVVEEYRLLRQQNQIR